MTFKDYVEARDNTIRIAIKSPERKLGFDQPGPMGQGISGGIGDVVRPANLSVQSPKNTAGPRPRIGTHQPSPAAARAPRPPSPPKPNTKVPSPIKG